MRRLLLPRKKSKIDALLQRQPQVAQLSFFSSPHLHLFVSHHRFLAVTRLGRQAATCEKPLASIRAKWNADKKQRRRPVPTRGLAHTASASAKLCSVVDDDGKLIDCIHLLTRLHSEVANLLAALASRRHAPKKPDLSGYQYSALSSLVINADRSQRRPDEHLAEPIASGRINVRDNGHSRQVGGGQGLGQEAQIGSAGDELNQPQPSDKCLELLLSTEHLLRHPPSYSRTGRTSLPSQNGRGQETS